MKPLNPKTRYKLWRRGLLHHRVYKQPVLRTLHRTAAYTLRPEEKP